MAHVHDKIFENDFAAVRNIKTETTCNVRFTEEM